jgi:hypothetical protein
MSRMASRRGTTQWRRRPGGSEAEGIKGRKVDGIVAGLAVAARCLSVVDSPPVIYEDGTVA